MPIYGQTFVSGFTAIVEGKRIIGEGIFFFCKNI